MVDEKNAGCALVDGNFHITAGLFKVKNVNDRQDDRAGTLK